MKPPLIWFNKALSNTWEILHLLQKERRPGEFRVLCTHPRADYPGQQASELFEQEPDGLGEEAYVEYCIDVVRRHRVDLFVPGRHVLPIVRALPRFEALGTAVVAAGDACALELVNHKGHVYAALAGADVPLPDYAVVNDLAGFDAAWRRLRPRHDRLCYKPAVSVYGIGFKIVVDEETGPARTDPWQIRLDDARRELDRRGSVRDLLVMQYLPGPERSVDCLARNGELVRCVVRRKTAGAQELEENPRLVALVGRIVQRLRLTHLFNVQFRDAGGTAHLLEINARMSGGLPFACQSGVVLPLWALRLALGTATPADVPEPRTGVWVPQPEPVSSL